MDETVELTEDTVWTDSDEIKRMLKAFEHSGVKARFLVKFFTSWEKRLSSCWNLTLPVQKPQKGADENSRVEQYTRLWYWFGFCLGSKLFSIYSTGLISGRLYTVKNPIKLHTLFLIFWRDVIKIQNVIKFQIFKKSYFSGSFC